MKPILFILAFFGVFAKLSAQTETYYIIHIKGTVLNQTSGKTLKVGDKLNATDKIKFNPDKAGAVVMGSQRGRFTLGKPVGERPSAAGEFISLIKLTLIPFKSNGQLSTRGGENEAVVDLKNVFGSQVFVFPGNMAKIVLSSTVYPMNNNKVMAYSFNYRGKVVNRPVPFSKDTLIFDRKSLYSADGQPVPLDSVTTVALYYLNKGTKAFQQMAAFKPVFITDEKALREECEVLIKVCKAQKMTENEILDELADHIAAVYGGETAKTDKHMLNLWLTEKMLKP